MEIAALTLGALGTNCYLVHNECGTFVIDPADDAARIEEEARRHGWHIDAIVFTHGHYDHIGAADALMCEKVHVHREDERFYQNPEYNLSVHFGASFCGKKPVIRLCEGDSFLGFSVLHTPGHTPGGICLYREEEQVLFSGDTLFCSGYGRTDFPGGSMMELRNSLGRLLALPENTKVYPGHGSSTTIAQERRTLGWKESR